LKTIINTSISLSILFAALSTTISCKNGGSTGYQKLKPGIEYNLFKTGKGDLIKDSSYVKMHIIQKAGDSTFVSTYKQPGEPVLQFLAKNAGQQGQGLDYSEVFFKMRAGDSVVIRLDQDTVFKAQKPPFLKKTDEVLVIVKFTEILGKQQRDSLLAEQSKGAAMQQSQMEEQRKAEMASASKLMPVEDAKLKAYAASNNLTVTKTNNGLYYAITTPGSGAKPTQGQSVTMNYTGSLLDGTKFDSNTDPAFNHVQPFEFKLGVGQVIPGWDEGIGYFPVGSKGVLLIPSYLAYGARGSGEKIKPNTILRFDVEVVSAK
jgi:FKBP-type peptidyl-prolyl cis-trans isomerase FkpA